MQTDPLQVLQAAQRPVLTQHKPRLVIAGATGPLGNEVLRQLAGSGRYERTEVLATEPITEGLRSVQVTQVPGGDPAGWPAPDADTAIVMFDPPRMFYQRERALWAPAPAQLPALAAWLRAGGVRTLAVVLPHEQGRLPEALKRGLASLDEHALAALGFERLLILRSAQKPAAAGATHLAGRLARFMLSVFQYMVPSSEQPVRALKVAQLLAAALRLAPPGIHVASPDLVWQAAQGDVEPAARHWLGV
jgi:hypothetical protein